MASPPARDRALRAAAGAGIDAGAVTANARELGVMGWVRPSGEIHAEGSPDAVQALIASVGDAGGIQGRALGNRPGPHDPVDLQDGEARPGSDIVAEWPESVLSGRTLAQLLR